MRNLLNRARFAWWWLSDPAWRQKYAAQEERIRQYRLGQRLAVKQLKASTGNHVVAGPFSGMKFVLADDPDSYCAHVLLGTYEIELRPALEQVCRTDYSLAVDIGASDGYYVCGLRLRLPETPLVAFETDKNKHDDIRRLIAANGVDHDVEIHGHCDAAALQACLRHQARPLVICDIEGGEVDVLDPATTPELTRADILVETHDGYRPGCTKLLTQRFAPTHDIQLISEQPRTSAHMPPGTGLSEAAAACAMDECRGASQAWLWMTARQPPAQ